MYKNLTALILMLTIVNQTIYSQNIDSLVREYSYATNQIEKCELATELAQGFLDNNQIDSADYFASAALGMAQKIENPTYRGRLYKLLGDIVFKQQVFDKADSFYVKALAFTTDREKLIYIHRDRYRTYLRRGTAKKGVKHLKEMRKLIGDDTMSVYMMEYYTSYSAVYGSQQKSLKQLQALSKAKDIAEKNGESTLFINYNLGTLYREIGDYKKSLKIFEETKEIANAKKAHNIELYAMYGMTMVQMNLKDYTGTQQTGYEAIALREKHDLGAAFGYMYSCIGSAHLKQNQLDSAEYYFQKGIDISLLQEENKELCDNYIGMSELMLKRGNKKEAKAYAEKSKALLAYTSLQVNNILHELYAEDGEYEKAYIALRENWDEQIGNDSSRTKIITILLEDKYKQERLLEAKKNEEKLAQQRRLVIGIIVLLLLVLGAVFLFIQVKNNRQLRKLNTSLNQRNEALEQFAYITSHDLKEPVRNIKSFSGLLSRKFKKRENTKDEQEYLDFISNSANTLSEIIQSLQTFTDVSFGKVVREEVELDTVFGNVQDNLHEVIQETNTELVFNNPSQISTISFSKPMLTLVLQNLIHNGIKYNEASYPVVKVTVSKLKNKTFFKIADNGIGIEEQYFDKIFQPFKTLTNKSINKSSGLGLAICKNIIENYDGKIWVESNGKTGSQFYFEI